MISVLCVDDDSTYLSLEKRSLEEPGVLTVTTALSAPEALMEMETNRFDAVVADYQMPGMDGIELLRAVRAANPGLPFILYSGMGREDVVIEAFNSGADFYLQKNGEPNIQFAQLKDTIFRAVKIGAVWQEFHDSEIRYRRLFETAQDGILILDAESGVITDANPFLLTLLGYIRDEMLGKKLWEIGFIRDKALAEQAAADLKRTGYIRYDDLPLETKDGRAVDVEFVCNVYVVETQKIIQCNIRDITSRRRAEEAMRTFGEDLERKVTERTSDLSDVNLKLMTEIDIRLDAEKQLTKTVGEKDVLLREVHHRVKNNLQIIISLLNLQSRYMRDETIISAFSESQNRIKAMALVHEKLYQSTNMSKIELDNYIRFLGDNLFQFFGMKGKGITFTTDIPDIYLAIDTAIPLGLMINELISNSLKYAFPDGRKGEISVAIHRQDHTLSILFADNGVGIPEDFDWRNANSLGLRLVVTLVAQLFGTIELDRTAGTTFTIVVKEKE